MKELFFIKLVYKINLIPPMLEGNVFCVLYSRSFFLLLVIYHVSCYNFGFFFKEIFQGKTVKTVQKLIELYPLIVSYVLTKISNRVSPSFVKMYPR